jgi:hypothetical protein
MSGMKGQRGRPKGTGLNDRPRLEAIAALIAANPQLKPTTAIRSLGYTDPSTIRRLRDKFHAARDTLMAERRSSAVAPAEAVQARATERPVVTGSSKPSAAPAIAVRGRNRKTPRRKETTRAPAANVALLSMAAHEPAGSGLKSVDVFACWWGVGLSMASATLDAQFTLFRQLMGLPQVCIAVDHQIALSEFAMATCAPRARRRTLLH